MSDVDEKLRPDLADSYFEDMFSYCGTRFSCCTGIELTDFIDGIAASGMLSVLNYILLGLAIETDGYYLHSFEVFLAILAVFPGSGNVGYVLLEYRLGHRSMWDSLVETCTWVPFLYISVAYVGFLKAHVYSLQLLLLRWSQRPPQHRSFGSHVLVQHYLGCNEKGSRAFEFLHRGSPNSQAFLACIRIIVWDLRYDSYLQPSYRRSGLADSGYLLGSYPPSRVSVFVRTATHVVLKFHIDSFLEVTFYSQCVSMISFSFVSG